MSSGILWIRRFLAAAHLAYGTALCLCILSYWVAWGFGLPHMLPHSPLTSLPVSFILAAGIVLLPGPAPGVMMLILARWLWTGDRRLRRALFTAHGLLLLPGILAIVWGLCAVAASERSSAQGGGLLGPVAFLPLLAGGLQLALSTCSIAAGLLFIPRQNRPG